MPGKQVKTSRLRTRAWQKRNAEWLDAYKAERGCARCGERDSVVLQFDHIDPATKPKHQYNPLRQNWTVNWTMLGKERREMELAKCQVLCANCHLRKTKKEVREFWDARKEVPVH